VERSDTHRVTMFKMAMMAGFGERPWTLAARRWVSQVLNPSYGLPEVLADVRAWVRKVNNLAE
jgi:hypothetical protein